VCLVLEGGDWCIFTGGGGKGGAGEVFAIFGGKREKKPENSICLVRNIGGLCIKKGGETGSGKKRPTAPCFVAGEKEWGGGGGGGGGEAAEHFGGGENKTSITLGGKKSFGGGGGGGGVG